MSGLVEFSKAVGVTKADKALERDVKRGAAIGGAAGVGGVGIQAYRMRQLAQWLGGKKYAQAMVKPAAIYGIAGAGTGAGAGAVKNIVRGRRAEAERSK